MANSTPRSVVFLPGSIMPAAIQYNPLIKVLGSEIQPLLKDLEIYSGDVPAPRYHLDQEVEGLKHFVDREEINIFHLVGYSGGGAVALAFVAAYPEKVKSLALSEPAVIPSQEWLKSEEEYMKALAQVMLLPPNDQMREFVRINLRTGVQPPPSPSGEPPAWMSKRPAGLKAMAQAFSTSHINSNQFRQFHNPVYLAVGSLSNPVEERKAETMAKLFSDFRVEVYAGRHHFDPPQRAEPERFAKAIVRLWEQAEQAAEEHKVQM
jgi:pimeloyl-ACP methyl ester carboxylesterase